MKNLVTVFFIIFSVFNTTAILEKGGLGILLLFVFIETAIFLGVLLPGGESLLFAAGLLVGTGYLSLPVFLLVPLLAIASAAGDVTGYFIGRKLGKRLFRKKDTWIFNSKNLDAAKKFYDKHGKMTIIFGKFIPVIRPMIPALSGAVEMPKSYFIFLSLISSTIWTSTFVVTAYFLGQKFPQLENYIIYLIPLTLILALIPIVRQYINARKTNRLKNRRN